MSTATPPALDLGAALRQTLQSFWDDFAPIVLLGFLFLTLPSLLLHASDGTVPDDGQPAGTTTSTLIQTFIALLAMIYVSAVNYGVMSSLAGRRLETTTFMWAGLRAARPGLLVALVLGSMLMATMIVVLLIGRGTALGWLVVAGISAAALIGFVTWLVAIPAAVAERRMPWDALRRSARLTLGSRGRLIAFVAVMMLGLLPGAMLIEMMHAPVLTSEPAIPEGALFRPGFWVEQLFWLLVQGILATAPAVVYVQLARRREATQP